MSRIYDFRLLRLCINRFPILLTTEMYRVELVLAVWRKALHYLMISFSHFEAIESQTIHYIHIRPIRPNLIAIRSLSRHFKQQQTHRY